MHIVFLTDNFPPEGNAPASRTFEHAREWVKAGHRVTVITTAPNFPEGTVFPGYRNSLFRREELEGIHVWRVVSYITANSGFARRILDYVSFMFTGGLAGLFVKKPDVVIATSPQFFTAVAGWFVAKLRRKPFVFELRDIWPASITAVGAMKKSVSIRLLEKLEMFLYRQADLIVSVTEAFKHELGRRGVNTDHIEVVRNGVDLSLYSPRNKSSQLIAKNGLLDKFVVGYIGTHGLAHDLPNILRAAEYLSTYKHIHFLFAGGGAGLSELRNLTKEGDLDNVTILGRQDKSMMPAIWSVCDVSLVHLRDTPLFASVIPSKIFESMGMGLPMIAAMPKGEATNIIEQNEAGLSVPPGDPQALASAVVNMAKNRELRQNCALMASQNAAKFDRKLLADDMLQHLLKLTGIS